MKSTAPLKKQTYLRNVSSSVSPITGEVVTIAAGAVGTLVDFFIVNRPILNSLGDDVGGGGDTSISITAGTALATQVQKKSDADLANGEFWVNHLTGRGRGRKGSTGTSITISYNILTIYQTGGGGGAPTNAQYVVLSTNATLTAERVLTGTANQIVITDNGAGSTVVLSLPQDIHTAAAPSFAGLKLVDAAVNQPATAIMSANQYLSLGILSATAGGVSMIAGTDTDAQPFRLTAFFGTASPTVTTPAIEFKAAKTDGSTGITALASTEMILKISNNTTQVMKIMGDGRVLIGSGTTVSYPFTITSAPVGGTVMGITPATVSTNDILFFLNSPSNTGNITAISMTGAIDGDLIGVVSNTNSSSASARAYFESRVNGASAGDAAYLYTISGVVNWISGVDNSNADSYSISAGSNLGTNDVLTLTRTPFLVGINKSVPTATLDIAQTVATSGSPIGFLFTAAAHTTLTASTEVTDVNFNLSRSVGITGGALTTNRSVRFQPITVAFTTASTLTNAINVDIGGAPGSGNANTTILNPSSLRIGGSATYLSNASLSYKNVLLASHTVTLSGTTTVTSTTPQSQLSVGTLTLTDASSCTVDFAASVYITGPVVAAGSVTITNSYAFWSDSGNNRFDGNVIIGGALAAGSTASGVLALSNGATAPTTSVDLVQLYGVDLSAGNATLGIFTETAVVTETVTSDRTLSVVINGTTYKICLKS